MNSRGPVITLASKQAVNQCNYRQTGMTAGFKQILSATVFFLFFAGLLVTSSYAVPTHLDRAKLKKECSECHTGHGKRGTVMLGKTKDEICFTCHGISVKQAADRNTDIYSVILKNSSHPIIQTAQYHVPGERLPDSSLAARRHVSCFDCHNVHKSEKENAIKELRGYSGRGASVKKVTNEYELCYNCHADQGNPAIEKGNIALAFDRSNASFHPVEALGRNSFVPSLRNKYTRSSIITCSDCHGNDDQSGPKGPHGSVYEPILKFRYIRIQGSESPSSYELCYSCHDRNSITSDQSFKAHKIHVVYNQVSCAQCHDAHGSRFNPSLIKFDENAVFPNSVGELTYMSALPGSPRCYLSCHVNGQQYEHKLNKTLTYCVNNRCLPQW